MTPSEAMAVVPRIPTMYDEPFADSSQIPTFLVSQLARRRVTVSLSGDGGDEIFGGYTRYLWANSVWTKLGHLSLAVRSTVAASMDSVSPEFWDGLFRSLGPILPLKYRFLHLGDKMHKLSKMIAQSSPESMYFQLVSHWENPGSVVLGSVEPTTVLNGSNSSVAISDFSRKMMFLDTVSFLPDDILVKVDRASMAVSLESRVPYLDHRVVEFAWKMPAHFRIRNRQGKWILRQILSKYVPPAVVERPKAGFSVPLHIWLRGPLRAWAEELLDESRLRQEGLFDPVPIRQKWAEQLSGRHNWMDSLWTVLMFQAWLEHERKQIAVDAA